MKITYSVYSIEDKELDMNRVYVLIPSIEALSSDFKTEDDAIHWIENHGVKNCNYVILKEFKKV